MPFQSLIKQLKKVTDSSLTHQAQGHKRLKGLVPLAVFRQTPLFFRSTLNLASNAFHQAYNSPPHNGSHGRKWILALFSTPTWHSSQVQFLFCFLISAGAQKISDWFPSLMKTHEVIGKCQPSDDHGSSSRLAKAARLGPCILLKQSKLGGNTAGPSQLFTF